MALSPPSRVLSCSAVAEGDPGLLATCLGSSAAGIFARVVCHPLDTAKARMQSVSGAEFKGTLHVLRTTLAEEGVRGLYRGFGAVLVGGTPGTCLYLTTYEYSKLGLAKFPALRDNQFVAHFTAGMAAETICCVVYVPVDVIKERLQVQRLPPVGTAAATAGGAVPAAAPLPLAYSGSLHAARAILATEGLRGIYKGYGATLASFGPFSALYFMFYEQLKALSQRMLRPGASGGSDGSGSGGSGPGGDVPFSVTLFNAAAAGSAASWITNPLDLAKLRLQVQRGQSSAAAAGLTATSAQHHYTGFFNALVQIHRVEGWRGLFRGSGARVAFHAPATAVSMATFEECRRFFSGVLGTGPARR